jgi:hypothetical protein
MRFGKAKSSRSNQILATTLFGEIAIHLYCRCRKHRLHMSSPADGQKEFLLNVRALVYNRLALRPVADSTNPNHGFDFEHAYFELLRHRNVLGVNEEAQSHDRKTMLGTNPGWTIDAEGVAQCSSQIPPRSKTLAKRPPEENPAFDLTLSPERLDAEQISKRVTQESTEHVHRTRGAAGNADQAANTRGARTRNKPPAQLLTRLNRALAHPLYLVEREKDGRSFAIVGASGAVYSVQIAEMPKCNCPDFVKRASGQRSSFAGPCKHILFVMHRVLKVDQFDSALYQVRLTQVELERIFHDSPEDPCSSLLADDALVRKFRESQDIEHRSNGRGGECPICMDILREGDKLVSVCSVCENCIHTDCMRMYLRAGVGRPKCPLCRSKWKPKAENEGPINLAKYSSKHSKLLTNAQLYPETHQFIGRSPRRRKQDK